MEKTEKFRMRKYFEKTGTNIYATPTRGVNKTDLSSQSEVITMLNRTENVT